MAKSENGRIAVCMACNDSYAVHACVVIRSAIENSTALLRFFIMSNGLCSTASRSIVESAAGSPVDFIEMDNSMFQPQDCVYSHITLEAQYRLKLPEILAPFGIDKALYLDCDLIVNDDLKKLFDTDISDFYAAAVDDIISERVPKSLGVGRYFNSGVLLLNLERLRAENVSKRIDALFGRHFKYIDQDILNIVYNGRVKFLPKRWNATNPLFRKDIYSGEQSEAVYNPAIVHFTGPDKPWKIPDGPMAHPYSPFYFYYLDETPYTGSTDSFKKAYSFLGTFFNYWRRHITFFLRPYYFEMRELYRINKSRFAKKEP